MSVLPISINTKHWIITKVRFLHSIYNLTLIFFPLANFSIRGTTSCDLIAFLLGTRDSIHVLLLFSNSRIGRCRFLITSTIIILACKWREGNLVMCQVFDSGITMLGSTALWSKNWEKIKGQQCLYIWSLFEPNFIVKLHFELVD